MGFVLGALGRALEARGLHGSDFVVERSFGLWGVCSKSGS